MRNVEFYFMLFLVLFASLGIVSSCIKIPDIYDWLVRKWTGKKPPTTTLEELAEKFPVTMVPHPSKELMKERDKEITHLEYKLEKANETNDYYRKIKDRLDGELQVQINTVKAKDQEIARLKTHETILLGLVKCGKYTVQFVKGYDTLLHTISFDSMSAANGKSLEEAIREFADDVQETYQSEHTIIRNERKTTYDWLVRTHGLPRTPTSFRDPAMVPAILVERDFTTEASPKV
jgi:hypothetical protein